MKLHPVPERAPRAVIYLRQSISREDSISLELQESAARDHCARRGYEVVAVEADPGISGRTFNRPAVGRVMGMVENGEADVVVLWKWSRLSRSRLHWAMAIDRVESAGGRVESATEDVDTSTSTGRFTRGMLSEIAAWESERIGEQWREAHEHRIAQGLPHDGVPRFGYTYVREEGQPARYEPHPETGPVVVAAYRSFIAGETFRTIVRRLNDAGYRSGKGGRWTVSTLSNYLDNGFAAGFIRWDKQLHPGAHQALLDAPTWETYQRERSRRRGLPPHTVAPQHEQLAGLVRCPPPCGAVLSRANATGGARIFRCSTVGHGGEVHGPTIRVALVEKALRGWIADMATDIEERGRVHLAQQAARVTVRTDRTILKRRISSLDGAAQRLTRSWAEEQVPLEVYRATLAEIKAEQAALQIQLDQLAGEAEALGGRRPDVAITTLHRDWGALDILARRELLRSVLRRITVHRVTEPQRLVPKWIWEPDDD